MTVEQLSQAIYNASQELSTKDKVLISIADLDMLRRNIEVLNHNLNSKERRIEILQEKLDACKLANETLVGSKPISIDKYI
jgi:predicted RNase H-like nuclease (RuvC/YqgF family)